MASTGLACDPTSDLDEVDRTALLRVLSAQFNTQYRYVSMHPYSVMVTTLVLRLTDRKQLLVESADD